MVDGLDLGALAGFLRSTGAVRNPGDRPCGKLRAQLIAGGKSNLTYRVTDGVHDWVVRRPPLGHVLATAHDMAREHRVMSALSGTTVPVPEMVALCEDLAVMGVPFYVMQYVEGEVLRRTAQSADLTDDQRADVAHRLVDTLADLHAVDPATVGLSDFGHPEGFLERQVRRWSAQLERSRTREVPGFPELAAALTARVPRSQRAGIVHGDYRLDNTVFDDRAHVRAILDWELCTLGDPMADLGLLMVYWNDRDEAAALGTSATTAVGMAQRADILERYATASGRDVSALPFYTAFGYWKLACIMQGVYARYLGGAGGGDTGSLDGYPETVAGLASIAADTLAAW
jgi:aminoglycoside phosphotransferase (APT) family kinase protein